MKKMLITGGAGFIGSNVAHHFALAGYDITIFDSLERKGADKNITWLKSNHSNIRVIKGNVKNYHSLKIAVEDKDIIFHLAGQVAVTTSVIDPRMDFEANALGTFNLLEAARIIGRKPLIVYTSTNKVYGGMEGVTIIKNHNRYGYKDYNQGISEKMCLDFHSPYGCSKGAADQYVRDYTRIYDIPTVVFRQSCIYGPRQFGIEDQGWVAWFIIALTLSKPITVYGDGCQVRDILYIDDLIALFELSINNINIVKGKVYNVGGGAENTLSVWSEFGPILESLFKRKITAKKNNWRLGDQKVYISDISFIKKELGWQPKIKVRDGIKKLFHWVQKNKELFKDFV